MADGSNFPPPSGVADEIMVKAIECLDRDIWDHLGDTVNEMILEAFADGYARACWELGQIADAALKTGEAK